MQHGCPLRERGPPGADESVRAVRKGTGSSSVRLHAVRTDPGFTDHRKTAFTINLAVSNVLRDNVDVPEPELDYGLQVDTSRLSLIAADARVTRISLRRRNRSSLP